MPSGSRPRRIMCSRSAPRHHGEHDVVDRPAERALDRLEAVEVALHPREAPVRPDRRVERARRRAADARGGHRGQPAERAGRAGAGLARIADRAERRTAPASSGRHQRGRSARRPSSVAPLGSGRGYHGGPGSRSGGSGSRSNSTVMMSTPEMPSTSAWWVLQTSANCPSPTRVDEPDLPQRLGAVELLGEHAAGQLAQLLLARRRRQRGVADVVADVEVRVVDPHRARLRERRERELLAVARDLVQAALDHRRRSPRTAARRPRRRGPSPRACARRASRARGRTRRGR